jgi:hypothetical protein
MQVLCKICKKESNLIFSSLVRNKYKANYYYCHHCGFLFIHEPKWLDEAYENPINITDTGLLQRNIFLRTKITPLLYLFFGPEKKYVDYGGGYGVFTRLMRDIGFDYLWYDPCCKNIFAQGFEIKEPNNNIALISSFECFEHLENPIETIQHMLTFSKNLVFTTELLPASLPSPNEWWYYGLEHGQHISFYQKKTLDQIANIFNLHYYCLDNFHIFAEYKINAILLKIIMVSNYKNLLYVGLIKLMSSKTISDMEELIYKVEKMHD